jgi:hypothetical protein
MINPAETQRLFLRIIQREGGRVRAFLVEQEPGFFGSVVMSFEP